MADKVAPYGISSLVTGQGVPQQQEPDPWAEFRIQPQQSPANDPWAEFRIPQQQKEPVSAAEDVARTILPGVSRGVSNLFGIPGDINKGIRWAQKKISGLSEEEMVAREREMDRQIGDYYNSLDGTPDRTFKEMPADESRVIGSQELQGAAQSAIPALSYHPQTTAGKYVNTVAEFAPGAVLAPGTAASKAVQTVIPAVASEYAGQKTEGTAWEPYARVGAALAGGVGAARALAPTTAEATMARHMTHVTEEQTHRARQLMESAQQQGVGLTWPEAIAHASDGATTLPHLQRMVEASPGGGEVMRGFMAPRPRQIEQAGRQTMGELSPQITTPSAIGPQIRGAAEDAIGDVRKGINAESAGLYEASQAVPIPNKQFTQLMQDPVFMEGYNRTYKSNPWIRGGLSNKPMNSVGMLDEVKKTLSTAEKNLASEINPNRDLRTAAVIGKGRERITDIAREASPEYGQALDIQKSMRTQYLDPLLEGPLGRLAKKDVTTQQAIEALFPSNPLPGSSFEVGETVRALAKKNPIAARMLVRAHAESVLNEATQKLASGPNEWGGAKFASTLMGNPEQKATLKAAIENLSARGPEVWKGFENFTNILEATGRRLQPGSPTAAIQKSMDAVKNGNFGEAAKHVVSLGTTIPRRLIDVYDKMRLEGGTEKLARLFTDPEAGKRLRHLSTVSPDSKSAILTSMRLLIIANQAGKNRGGRQ